MATRGVKLFKRKMCVKPTIWGWLVIIAVILLVGRASLTGIVKFLSLNDPVESKTMVLEGWVPTYAVKDAMKYFRDNEYERLIITGIPIVNYEFIAPYKNTAEATLLAVRYYGYNDTVYLAEIPTTVLVDRTYNTAVETKLLFDSNPDWPKSMNIYSVGVHARRTYTMFRNAFGNTYNIGVLSQRDRTFDPMSWWKSSKGFRNVSNEFIATLYVMAFFHPNLKDAINKINYGNYLDKIYYERQDKHVLFSDSVDSPFNDKERSEFRSFSYFDPDTSYRVKAHFTVDTSSPIFNMPTNTERAPEYRIYGNLEFTINDTLCSLTVYQNMAFINNKEYGNLLFVPFTDKSNSATTYAAGRYLDIPIPDKDTIIIDFNNTYNPYCAYSERWSCPLVPFDNNLDVNIKAGEKRYKNH